MEDSQKADPRVLTQHSEASQRSLIIYISLAVLLTSAVMIFGFWWFMIRPTEPQLPQPQENPTGALFQDSGRGFTFKYPAELFTTVESSENFFNYPYAPYYGDGYGYGGGDGELRHAAATSVFRADGPQGKMEVLVLKKTFHAGGSVGGSDSHPIQVGNQVGVEYVTSENCYAYNAETSLGIETLLIKLETCTGHTNPFNTSEQVRKDIYSGVLFTKQLSSVSPLYEVEKDLLKNLNEVGRDFFEKSIEVRSHWAESHPLKYFKRDRDGDGIVEIMDEEGYINLMLDRYGANEQFMRFVAECGSRQIIQKQRMWVQKYGRWWPFGYEQYYVDNYEKDCASDPHEVYYIDSDHDSY